MRLDTQTLVVFEGKDEAGINDEGCYERTDLSPYSCIRRST